MKIIILSYFPKYSALWWYGFYLNQELIKNDNFDVTFINLFDFLSPNPLIKTFHLLQHKTPFSCDILIGVSPLLSKIIYNSNAKHKIIIEHDLYPLIHKFSINNFLLKKIYSYSLKATKIISISTFAAKEFSNYYKLSKSPETIYGGIDHINYYLGTNTNNFDINNLSFIHIGRSDKRKNVLFLLKTVERFKGSKLIKIGDFTKSEKKYISKNSLNVEIKQNLDQKSIREIFLTTDFLLFPSTYEGFGLPPLEAMACGCLVLAGDNTGLKESCFKECRLELNLDLWESRIKEICSNKNLQKKLREKGLAHSSTFRWDKFTRNLTSYF